MPEVPFISKTMSPDANLGREPNEGPQKLSLVALRERKKDQTREALARAAFDLFRDKGYEATTVAQIARAANVSRRTFFRYYATKDALLFVEDSENLEHFRDLLSTRESSDEGVSHVRRACLSLAEDYMRDREQILARAHIIESSPVLSKQERQQDMLWEQAIAAALLAIHHTPPPISERRARMVAGAIFGAMRATMAAWRDLDGRADLPRLMAEAFDLVQPRRLDYQPPAPASAN
jgi:AcrR family transcriptional regulator